MVFATLLVGFSLVGCPVGNDSPLSNGQESLIGQQSPDSSADNSSSQTLTPDDGASRPVVPVTDDDRTGGTEWSDAVDSSIPPEVLAALLQDSDKDGRTDLDELVEGTNPNDPSDGPDIDGDGVPNDSDPDIDGDGIPNAYDDDVDGDGLLNKSDPDMDGDGKKNDVDDDPDGDGIEKKKDNDDDADGKRDPEDDDECDSDVQCKDGQQCKDGDCVPFDLLALAVRLFDDAENRNEKPELVAKARQAFKEEDGKPGSFDFQEASKKFFKEVLAEVENEAGALEEARDFYGRLFDQDGDGKPDFSDPDRNGDGITDAPEVQ